MSLLKNVQTKTGWLLPAGLKANIHFPSGKNENYESAIAGDDKGIAKALLVPNLLGISEQGSAGSYAQSQTQLEAFLWTLDKLALRLSEALNEQLFRELGDLNFGDGVYPQFCFHPISESLKMNVIRTWRELVSGGAVEATDGELGVATALEQVPDLILMDVQLPKMSGLDATRRLRADPKTAAIPIIVITSFALSGDDQKAKDAGATGYMAKPYSPRELLQMIRNLLPEQ